jgi:acetylornithine deacetylase/succinyl-diaminopimelate desuccinylase-like protein
VIHLKGKDKAKALIFNAHLDTVGAGDLSKWKYLPFGKDAGKIIGGKLYGLGTSDDKAAIAAMLLLCSKTRSDLVLAPPIDLWFTFVAKEETSGDGTAAFLDWFTGSKYYKSYKKIAAIIGEPTGLKVIEIGHRGNYFLKLQTKGVSGHGAKEYKGSDLAVNKTLKALDSLSAVFPIWKKAYKDPILGKPEFNITGISANASSINKIPPNCKAWLDIRTTPKLHARLPGLLADLLGKKVIISQVEKDRSYGLTNPHSHLVKTFRKVIPKVPFGTSLGSTDIFLFNKYGIEAVVFGPGEKKVIHKENEYCILKKVERCIDIYKKVIDIF